MKKITLLFAMVLSTILSFGQNEQTFPAVEQYITAQFHLSVKMDQVGVPAGTDPLSAEVIASLEPEYTGAINALKAAILDPTFYTQAQAFQADLQGRETPPSFWAQICGAMGYVVLVQQTQDYMNCILYAAHVESGCFTAGLNAGLSPSDAWIEVAHLHASNMRYCARFKPS